MDHPRRTGLRRVAATTGIWALAALCLSGCAVDHAEHWRHATSASEAYSRGEITHDDFLRLVYDDPAQYYRPIGR